jgi:hypothetical protein
MKIAGERWNAPDRASPERRSMQNNSTTGLQNSGTETQLQQVLAHLQMHSLGEPTCQVCNERIREGDQITVYFHKPTDRATYRIGQCRCSAHKNDLTALFTLGVSELIVDGRVGHCQDQATQQTWPVLFSPTVRLISVPETKGGRTPTPETDSQDQETTEWQYGMTATNQVAKQSDESTRSKQPRTHTRPIDTEEHQ